MIFMLVVNNSLENHNIVFTRWKPYYPNILFALLENQYQRKFNTLLVNEHQRKLDLCGGSAALHLQYRLYIYTCI